MLGWPVAALPDKSSPCPNHRWIWGLGALATNSNSCIKEDGTTFWYARIGPASLQRVAGPCPAPLHCQPAKLPTWPGSSNLSYHEVPTTWYFKVATSGCLRRVTRSEQPLVVAAYGRAAFYLIVRLKTRKRRLDLRPPASTLRAGRLRLGTRRLRTLH